jgi:hypothetical protein
LQIGASKGKYWLALGAFARVQRDAIAQKWEITVENEMTMLLKILPQYDGSPFQS